MAVTARLSRRFYEQFGDETTQELVEWFNAMESNTQLQIRELHELSAAKLSTELQMRFAEQDVRIERRFAEMEVLMSKQFAELDMKFTRQIAEVRADLRTEFHITIAKVESRLAWQMTGICATLGIVLINTATQFLHR